MMFEPNFKYTNKIVNNLIESTSARAIIFNAYLVPKWEVSLRRDALISAVHSSTAIEGNPLTIDEVSELALGRKVMATRKAKQEVLNYLNVLENIEGYADEGGVITGNNILKMHKGITKDTLDKPCYEGRYREVQVYVGNRITGEVIFMPPPPQDVPGLMMGFLNWLNSELSHQLKFALDRQKRDRKGQIALTEKQMKIIEYIQRYGQISSGDVAKMFALTRQAALKQLSKLVELEVIKLEGKGRGAHYVIV